MSESQENRTVIRTPDQRLRVFISSTLQELADERAAAKEAILRLHLSPVMFELGARPHPARELYRAYLEQSHIFVGIYWQRYGWVAPDMSISGLEDEYRLCGNRPKLVYVKASTGEREPRLKELLNAIKNDAVSYKAFATADELRALIEDDLSLLLTEQFELAQLVHDQAAAAAPPAEATLRFDNLPAPSTRLIGREAELEAIKDLVLRQEVRLVTLTGPGGIGKTRLAIEVAQQIHTRFENGACFVSLAAATDEDGFILALSQALSLRETLGPLDTRPLFQKIKDRVCDKQVLIVLDNFEQVVAAAPLVGELMLAAPRVEIIVSSREVLHLNGEYELAVSPLTLPDEGAPLEVLRNSSAVQLFVERCRAAQSNFALTEANAPAIGEICRSLDGLPLALELAAARIRLLTPQMLLARLTNSLQILTGGARDLPQRQRTLRQTIDWSYSLLSSDEQAMFARFSVFVGGCTLDAAEAVLSAPPLTEITDGLASLIDKSLLQRREHAGESRLWMLQTLREYAAEKLAERGETELMRERHARCFDSLVYQAQAEINSKAESQWMQRLDQEGNNLRVAMQWFLAQGNATIAAHFAWTLWQFWVAHTSLSEWRQWTDQLMTQLKAVSSVRAKALALSGAVASWQGDYARGIPLLREGAAMFEQLGKHDHLTNTLMMLGIALMNHGDLDEASQVLARGLG